MSLLTLLASRAATGGAAAFDWTQFFGVSDTGYVSDGTQSKFYTDIYATFECSASGTDPVGRIESLAGKTEYSRQGALAARPTFYESGGIKHMKIGQWSGQGYYMDIGPATTDLNGNFSFAVVFKVVQTGPNNSLFIISNYPGGWGPFGYFALRHYDGNIEANAGSGWSPAQIPFAEGSSGIAVWTRSGTGANQTVLSLYQLDGTLIGTVASTQSKSYISPVFVGSGTLLGDNTEARVPFVMFIRRALSTDEKSLIVSTLASKYGSWTP